MYRYSMKITAIIALAFFMWSSAGFFQLSYAAKNLYREGLPDAKKSEKDELPGDKIDALIQGARKVINNSRIGNDEKREKLISYKKAIEIQYRAIQDELAKTEEKIKNENLPDVILERHNGFVRQMNERFSELSKTLLSAKNAEKTITMQKNVSKMDSTFKKLLKPQKDSHIDPDNLPHRSRQPVDKKPRLDKKDFEDAYGRNSASMKTEPRYLASIGSLRGILGADVALASETLDPQYLSETIEVVFTSDILAKAEELDHDPVKIYNWVRNNIEFVPTYGSIQGAQMTLETLQGNAFDTASLLVALLRASDIPSRYVLGTVEIPIEQVMNWAGGFTNPQAALDFMASGGIPVSGLLSGGKIAKAHFEHVWVEAYVDYIPGRAARHRQGQGDTWVSLDAAFKQYDYTQGIDIQAAVPFNAQEFVDQVQVSATINETDGYVTGLDSLFVQGAMQDYSAQVESYLTQNYPDATVGEVLGQKNAIKQEFTYLLGSLPYHTSLVGGTYAVIPNTLRHKLTFTLQKNIFERTPLTFTQSLPELAGKKITLSYSPATPDNEAVIESYLPEPHANGTPIQPDELPDSLPAYLIDVTPELRIDGDVVASGSVVGLGNTETFTMQFYDPASTESPIINEIDAGVYQAIGLNVGRVSQEQFDNLKARLEETKSKLETEDYSNITKEELLGDLFHTTALVYHAELGINSYVSAKTIGVASAVLPSETIFGTGLKIESSFGIPRTVISGGLVMDADRLMHTVKAKDGDSEKAKMFMLSTGMMSSVLENKVPEQLFSTDDNSAEGISAVRALKLANDRNIPIYTVTQANIATVLPQLQVDAQEKSEIANAVYAGKEVTVSQTNIEFNGWTGCGYIIADPGTGAGAYIISGGLNGSYYLGLFLGNLLSIIAVMSLASFSGWVIFPILLSIFAHAVILELIFVSASDSFNSDCFFSGLFAGLAPLSLIFIPLFGSKEAAIASILTLAGYANYALDLEASRKNCLGS